MQIEEVKESKEIERENLRRMEERLLNKSHEQKNPEEEKKDQS